VEPIDLADKSQLLGRRLLPHPVSMTPDVPCRRGPGSADVPIHTGWRRPKGRARSVATGRDHATEAIPTCERSPGPFATPAFSTGARVCTVEWLTRGRGGEMCGAVRRRYAGSSTG
jgi:hypothetical protein